MTGYSTDVSPVIVDIETAPLENVRDYLDPPTREGIKAPSNYTKPESIAKYIEEAYAERCAKFEEVCAGKAALDPDLARIVCLGIVRDRDTHSWVCRNQAEEISAINRFWYFTKHRQIVGFNIREFDLPMIIQRSRYLNLPHRLLDLGRYSRGSFVVDLIDVLTFNGLRRDHLMSHSLASYRRRFGLPAPLCAVEGSDIPRLVDEGSWGAVEAHNRDDLDCTAALAERLGVIRQTYPPVIEDQEPVL